MPIQGRGQLEAAFPGHDWGTVVGAGTFGKVVLATDQSGVKAAQQRQRQQQQHQRQLQQQASRHVREAEAGMQA